MADPPPIAGRIFIFLQHLLPKGLLSRLAGCVARWRGGVCTTALVRCFIRHYRVNMLEAAQPEPSAYETFNDFFTRALHPDARPQARARWTCPVDGAISQCGAVVDGQIFQAKGHSYSAQALLGGNATSASHFQDGHFATLYLSPRDYHRVHMPAAGRLIHMSHVPGSLYSVNPTTARGITGLFARNERVVCLFESEYGPFAMVLVGATIVGSMATTWHGVVRRQGRGTLRRWDYLNQQIRLGQGEEMGRFLLGSTVIVLFPPGPFTFESGWTARREVRVGEAMAG